MLEVMAGEGEGPLLGRRERSRERASPLASWIQMLVMLPGVGPDWAMTRCSLCGALCEEAACRRCLPINCPSTCEVNTDTHPHTAASTGRCRVGKRATGGETNTNGAANQLDGRGAGSWWPSKWRPKCVRPPRQSRGRAERERAPNATELTTTVTAAGTVDDARCRFYDQSR